MKNEEYSMLSLPDIAANPELLTIAPPSTPGLVLRPLTQQDETGLRTFLESLSPTSRRFYSVSKETAAEASERCRAIGKYDKLRFVLDDAGEVAGLFEFSLDLVEDDVRRYARHGIPLSRGRTIRFGPCVLDKHQGQGLARNVMPYLEDIARRLGRSRMILWGGVHVENLRAIRFYERVGFTWAGEFTNAHGDRCSDMYRDV